MGGRNTAELAEVAQQHLTGGRIAVLGTTPATVGEKLLDPLLVEICDAELASI